VIAQLDGNLRAARDAKILSDAQYQTAKKDYLGKADQATALRMIRDNPGGTSTMLAKSDFLPNLDPVARQNLIDRAGNEVLRRANLAYTQAARADLAERRATTLASNEIMKRVIDESNTPDGVSDDTLAMGRKVLPWHDYQAAQKLKTGGAEVDSKAALAAIVPDIDTRDVSKDLSDQLLKNQITSGTYKTLIERNRAALRDDQPTSPYRQGRDYIKTILDPSATGLGSATVGIGGITAGLRADALMEYDSFVDANRDKIKANPTMALDYARDVGTRYRLVEFSTTTQALGVPRFYAGSRQQLQGGDETGLTEATRETVKRREAGELSDGEYLQQARTLRAWAAALQAQKTMPKPGEQKPGGAK
jgi:hypothetical protein